VNSLTKNRISEHVPRHVKPHITVNGISDFGHYLAGLIEGDGHFSVQGQLVISFHENDSSLAYYIKSVLGHGSVANVKNKRAILLRITSRPGILTVLSYISGKMKTEAKVDQVIRNILPSYPDFPFSSELNLDFNNF
jgi:hypothetical protein